jgi:hypothetical protein
LTDRLLGEQLESVHASRLRAQTAHDLIDYYIQFSRDDVTKIDVLRKESGKEGRMKLAVLLRRLHTAAKEVDIPIAEQVCSECQLFHITSNTSLTFVCTIDER